MYKSLSKRKDVLLSPINRNVFVVAWLRRRDKGEFIISLLHPKNFKVVKKHKKSYDRPFVLKLRQDIREVFYHVCKQSFLLCVVIVVFLFCFCFLFFLFPKCVSIFYSCVRCLRSTPRVVLFQDSLLPRPESGPGTQAGKGRDSLFFRLGSRPIFRAG